MTLKEESDELHRALEKEFSSEPHLLTRLRNHCAMLAPHQKVREGGKLLLAAIEELTAKDAEIARLRKQCEGLAQAALNNGQDLLLKEAEIARLHESSPPSHH